MPKMSTAEDFNPIEDCTEDPAAAEAFRMVELSIDLHRALSPIPDALQWLQLVEQGYKPLQAGKMLGKNWWWVKKVQRAVQQALHVPPI